MLFTSEKYALLISLNIFRCLFIRIMLLPLKFQNNFVKIKPFPNNLPGALSKIFHVVSSRYLLSKLKRVSWESYMPTTHLYNLGKKSSFWINYPLNYCLQLSKTVEKPFATFLHSFLLPRISEMDILMFIARTLILGISLFCIILGTF